MEKSNCVEYFRIFLLINRKSIKHKITAKGIDFNKSTLIFIPLLFQLINAKLFFIILLL
jgi:hypothetical protein